MAQRTPVLVIIDTLTLLASVLGIRDLHGAGDLGVALAGLAALARDSDAAIVILHHNRKNPSGTSTTGDKFGEYRDSTAIGAAADMIVSLSPESGARTRRLTLKGRWFEPTLIVTLGPEGYTLQPADEPTATDETTDTPAPRPSDQRVLLHLLRCDPQARPGAAALAEALDCSGRRYQDLRKALDGLVDAGNIDYDQRPGTTKKRDQGYALTAQGRSRAEHMRIALLNACSAISANGKLSGNQSETESEIESDTSGFPFPDFPQGGVGGNGNGNPLKNASVGGPDGDDFSRF